jgi:hypothetical protein
MEVVWIFLLAWGGFVAAAVTQGGVAVVVVVVIGGVAVSGLMGG